MLVVPTLPSLVLQEQKDKEPMTSRAIPKTEDGNDWLFRPYTHKQFFYFVWEIRGVKIITDKLGRFDRWAICELFVESSKLEQTVKEINKWLETNNVSERLEIIDDDIYIGNQSFRMRKQLWFCNWVRKGAEFVYMVDPKDVEFETKEDLELKEEVDRMKTGIFIGLTQTHWFSRSLAPRSEE